MTGCGWRTSRGNNKFLAQLMFGRHEAARRVAVARHLATEKTFSSRITKYFKIKYLFATKIRSKKIILKSCCCDEDVISRGGGSGGGGGGGDGGGGCDGGGDGDGSG